VELKLRTVGCDGVSNAWYQKPAPGSSNPPSVNVCYEYIAEIQQSMPPGTMPAGINPMNAMMGQFFYVFAHETGHAMFDVLGVPVMGREEDAADNFATYLPNAAIRR
jgi:Putative metallopeptidase